MDLMTSIEPTSTNIRELLSSSNLRGLNLQLDPIVLQYLINVKTNCQLQPSYDVVVETI